MKKVIYIVLLTILCSTVTAQTDTLKVSLKQAVETGLKNRYDVRSNKYNISIAENAINRSKKEWIPDVTGSGNLRYNSQLKKQIIPAGVLGNSESMAFSLDTKTNSVYSLDLTQAIYNPEITSDIKIAKNNFELEKEKDRQIEINTKTVITESYLNILLKKLQFKIAKNNEIRYSEYLEVAEGKYKYGSLLENDFLKAELDYENAKVETQKSLQNYNLAIYNFKYQINIDSGTIVILADSMNTVSTSINPPQQQDVATNRSEIKQLQLVKENNELQLKKAYQNTLPSVSLFANYSSQFQYRNFDYTQKDWWSPYSYVGVKISLPITSNYKNSNTIRESRFKSAKTGIDIKQKTADITYEIKKASTELGNALQNMQTTKANYDLSNTIYENQKQQYNLGSFQYSSLLDTEKTLNTAEQNYIKAVYDYLIAMLDYDKALGN
jgi:outer membrane protein TolC